MFSIRFNTLHFGLMLAATLSVSMLPAAGQAYTPEQQQACSGDAFCVCGSDIPDVDRVTACMIRNQSQLSPGCRAFFRAPELERAPVVTRVSTRRPLSIKPAVGRKPLKRAKPKKLAKPA